MFSLKSLIGVALLSAVILPYSVNAQGLQVFYCTPNTIQSFTVPAGVTHILASIHGAHGGNPGNGAKGGFGGLTQGQISVTPGQVLFIWVGCIDEPKKIRWGYGSGGDKGTAPGGYGDGGFGGGGSAITLNSDGTLPLLVAGGGGGGGGDAIGNAAGGVGGNGGLPPQDGRPGFTNSGRGGIGGGSLTNDGEDGEKGSNKIGAGGGGGGGGCPGGGRGPVSPPDGTGAAAGGGGGASFAYPTVTNISFGQSPLGLGGFVQINWGASLPNEDGDPLQDSLDSCRSSDLRPTVFIDGHDTSVENALEVDGCTISDRIAKIAADTPNHGQFVVGIVELSKSLEERQIISRKEAQALIRAAAEANLPPRR